MIHMSSAGKGVALTIEAGTLILLNYEVAASPA